MVHPAESTGLDNEPKSGISEKSLADLFAFGIRSIQRHNDFKLRVTLFSHTFERFFQKGFAVINRNTDGHALLHLVVLRKYFTGSYSNQSKIDACICLKPL